MGFFSGILKKVAPIAASFIPGVGPIIAPMVAGAIKAYDANKAGAVTAGTGSNPVANVNADFNWEGLAGGLADVAGSAIGQYQTQKANQSQVNSAAASAQQQNERNVALMHEQQAWNAAEADKARQFNSAEAATNRDFQERMSNSQYQRAVGDLSAAGLNPMLAYSQGGAGNVGGATASGPAASSTGTPQMNNIGAAAISTSKEAADLDNALKMGDQIDARTHQIRQDTETSHQSAQQIEASRHKIHEEIVYVSRQAAAIAAQVGNTVSSTRLNEITTELRDIERQLVHKTITNTESLTRLNEIKGDLANLEKPEAKAKADAWSTSYGRNGRAFLPDLGTALGTAGSLFRAAR